jgi:antitoxin FitA
MASLTIRNLDESVKQNIRLRAATHGVSMEEEARIALAEKYGRRDNKIKSIAELDLLIASLNLGDAIDPAIEAMDHKTLTDKMWDGEL